MFCTALIAIPSVWFNHYGHGTGGTIIFSAAKCSAPPRNQLYTGEKHKTNIWEQENLRNNSSIHSSRFLPNLHSDPFYRCYHSWFNPKWSPSWKAALTLFFLGACPWYSHIHTSVGRPHIALKGRFLRDSVVWKWTSPRYLHSSLEIQGTELPDSFVDFALQIPTALTSL